MKQHLKTITIEINAGQNRPKHTERLDIEYEPHKKPQIETITKKCITKLLEKLDENEQKRIDQEKQKQTNQKTKETKK